MIKLHIFCSFFFVLIKPVKMVDHIDFQIIHSDDVVKHHNANMIDLIVDHKKNRQFFYAIEVSPKSNFLLDYNVFKTMRTKPLFTSITWHLNQGFEQNVSLLAPYRMFEQINSKYPTLLHLSCFNLTESNLDMILKHNVTNIFVVRGDRYLPHQPYQHAVDLVEAIRNKTQSHRNISIGVAAYPEKHYDAVSFDTDLLHLKEKVDAGADFIITQICFSATKIIDFIDAARSLNITVPIIPGIFIPQSYNQLRVVSRWIPIEVPDDVRTRLEHFKNVDDRIFRPLMNQIIIDLIHELKEYTERSNDFRIPGVQLFTFNVLDNVLEVIDGADL